MCVSQGPKQKGIGPDTGKPVRVYLRPALFFSILRWGLVYTSGVEHRECNPRVKKDRERFIPTQAGSSKPIKEKGWEEPLQLLGAPSLGIRTLGGLASGLKVLEELESAADFPQRPGSLQ